jgi:hypothetical protein
MSGAENGDGTFTATDTFKRYSKLDQYLMGLRGPSEVPPLMLITNPQPLLSGTIGSFLSTFDKTDNAFRDAGKDFGSLDRLKGLRLAIQLSSTSASATVITHSGQTENGAALDTISTDVNLKNGNLGRPHCHGRCRTGNGHLAPGALLRRANAVGEYRNRLGGALHGGCRYLAVAKLGWVSRLYVGA